MDSFELLATAFFAGLAIVAAGRRRARRSVAVAIISLAAALFVFAVAHHAPDAVRAWAPHAYLIAGYWLPALLARRPASATRLEQWLTACDRSLCSRLPALPPWLVRVVELAYLTCYPL